MNIHFALRSYRSWIFNVFSVLRSWASWILRILDLRFCFIVGSWRSWISIFCFCGGIIEILDPTFLFGREILEILDPGMGPGTPIACARASNSVSIINYRWSIFGTRPSGFSKMSSSLPCCKSSHTRPRHRQSSAIPMLSRRPSPAFVNETKSPTQICDGK